MLGTLVEYYEIMSQAGKISRPGYCNAGVSFALNLSSDGELIGILPLKVQVQGGKKDYEVPQAMQVPQQVKKTVGVVSNFLCENSGYILGLDQKGKPERSKQCFEAFKSLHEDVLKDTDCAAARALLLFLKQWDPETAANNTVIADYLDALTSGGNIIFNLAGQGYLQNDPAICQAWEKHKVETINSVKMQCLVTGQNSSIARLHASIKGVKGAQATGSSIVSFNANAYESYGREGQQGLNAPVSEYAAFAYTTALNYLLADNRHKQFSGDTTIVYWAQSSKSIYQDLFEFSLNPEQNAESSSSGDEVAEAKVVDTQTEGLLKEVFQRIVSGKPLADLSDAFDPSTTFYVLGLAPNASRLSIRFFMKNSFGAILKNVAAHYNALEIEHSPNEFTYLPLWKLLLETVNPKSRDKASSPLLSGAVFRSIIEGLSYPESLYGNVIVRIRAERDISRGKAAIIKAFLLKKYTNQKYKEELTVSLNEQSDNKAYILGRLFSALEKAQLDASPGINATIKDRYFTSACATPATAFPILLRLSNHHMAKAEYGYISERRISELLDRLDVKNVPFPSHLNLEEQGLFILGYYHQQKANYAKKEKEEN